jgi:hypothetical protein
MLWPCSSSPRPIKGLSRKAVCFDRHPVALSWPTFALGAHVDEPQAKAWPTTGDKRPQQEPRCARQAGRVQHELRREDFEAGATAHVLGAPQRPSRAACGGKMTADTLEKRESARGWGLVNLVAPGAVRLVSEARGGSGERRGRAGAAGHQVVVVKLAHELMCPLLYVTVAAVTRSWQTPAICERRPPLKISLVSTRRSPWGN